MSEKFFGFEMPTAFDVPKSSLWAVPIKPSYFLEPETLVNTFLNAVPNNLDLASPCQKRFFVR